MVFSQKGNVLSISGEKQEREKNNGRLHGEAAELITGKYRAEVGGEGKGVQSE